MNHAAKNILCSYISLCSFISQVSIACLLCVPCCAQHRANPGPYPGGAHNLLGQEMRAWTMTKKCCVNFHDQRSPECWEERRGLTNGLMWRPERLPGGRGLWGHVVASRSLVQLWELQSNVALQGHGQKCSCDLVRARAALAGHRADPDGVPSPLQCGPWRPCTYSPRLTSCQAPTGHRLVLVSWWLFGMHAFHINCGF